MGTSRPGAGFGALIRALVALAAMLAAMAGNGCARSGAAPPRPPAARQPARGQAGSAPTGRSPAPSSTQAPAVPDPSEEITPEELSTIPEPVPRSTAGGSGRNPQAPLPTAQAASEQDSEAIDWPVEPPATARAPEGATAAAPTSLWRVQVFATQDRDLADRMAREAAVALHVAARVDHEGTHYKVRLGDFSSEDAALPLREEAIRSGYPGAFRTRCATDASKSTN
jgi:sporulation related protein